MLYVPTKLERDSPKNYDLTIASIGCELNIVKLQLYRVRICRVNGHNSILFSKLYEQSQYMQIKVLKSQ